MIQYLKFKISIKKEEINEKKAKYRKLVKPVTLDFITLFAIYLCTFEKFYNKNVLK